MKKLLLLLVLTCMASFAATITIPLGTPQPFSWGSGNPITIPGGGVIGDLWSFTVPAATNYYLHVVDCCIIGDEFNVYESFLGQVGGTSAADPWDGVASGSYDFWSSWADGRLSRGIFAFGPGNWQVAITVSDFASQYSSGGGFVYLATSPIPEPGTYALMGAGLLALAGLARRRKA